MSRTTLTLPALRCDRCGHTWIQRRPELPKVCSKCKREDWDRVGETYEVNGKIVTIPS